MGLIVSPTPTVLTITIDDATGKVEMQNSRDIEFEKLMSVFGMLIVQIAGNVVLARQGIPPAAGISLKKGSTTDGTSKTD